MNFPQLESFHPRILFPAYTLIVYADSELYGIHLYTELNYINYPKDMKPCKWNAIIKNINLYWISPVRCPPQSDKKSETRESHSRCQSL